MGACGGATVAAVPSLDSHRFGAFSILIFPGEFSPWRLRFSRPVLTVFTEAVVVADELDEVSVAILKHCLDGGRLADLPGGYPTATAYRRAHRLIGQGLLAGGFLWWSGLGVSWDTLADAEAWILGNMNLQKVITVATDINEDADDSQPGNPRWEYVDPTVGEYRAHAHDPGTDDLTFIWRVEPGAGGLPYDVMHLQLNGVGPEPDYDSGPNEVRTPGGTYPFDVVDVLVVGYPEEAGTGVSASVRCLQDDDGGTSDDASDCDPPVPPIARVDWSFSFTITYSTISGGFRVATVAAAFSAYDPKVVPIVVGADFP